MRDLTTISTVLDDSTYSLFVGVHDYVGFPCKTETALALVAFAEARILNMSIEDAGGRVGWISGVLRALSAVYRALPEDDGAGWQPTPNRVSAKLDGWLLWGLDQVRQLHGLTDHSSALRLLLERGLELPLHDHTSWEIFLRARSRVLGLARQHVIDAVASMCSPGWIGAAVADLANNQLPQIHLTLTENNKTTDGLDGNEVKSNGMIHLGLLQDDPYTYLPAELQREWDRAFTNICWCGGDFDDVPPPAQAARLETAAYDRLDRFRQEGRRRRDRLAARRRVVPARPAARRPTRSRARPRSRRTAARAVRAGPGGDDPEPPGRCDGAPTRTSPRRGAL